MPRVPIGSAPEHWPPRGPSESGWPGRGRIARRFVGVVLLFFLFPIALGIVVAAGFAGWAGAAVVVAICLGLLLTGLLFSRFVFRSFRSVNELVGSTERLSEGDYSVRMGPSPSPAFRPATESFNRMAERLETSDDLRRRLLADVGHELRTPLTIIRGELEAMADGVRDLNEEEIRRLLGDVAAMERLLDDLKTLSTTEAGVLDLHVEPTNVTGLVEEIVGRFAGEAADRGVTLSVLSSDDREPEVADIDPYRIGEVISNVIVNALRATTPNGRIDLRVGGGLIDDRSCVIIEVTDDGTGIPADRLEAVFDRFHKGADSSGSGLGLTISRDLVRAHDGEIAIVSTIGSGTTITVSLPR